MSVTRQSPATQERMRLLAHSWEEVHDGRASFLACYQLMTDSMVTALDAAEFDDPEWVDRLLVGFARRYFDALDAFDAGPDLAPSVWRLAHASCCDPNVWTLQRLLLGINAHINVDLPITVSELLIDDASAAHVATDRRLADYLRVNEIISRTMDEVQDSVLEAEAPGFRVLDVILGRGDEFLASRLLFRWRDQAWENAVRLSDTSDPELRAALLLQMEEDAVRTGEAILLTDGPASVLDLFR